MRSTVALYRDVATDSVVEDHGREVKLKAGERVICHLVSLAVGRGA